MFVTPNHVAPTDDSSDSAPNVSVHWNGLTGMDDGFESSYRLVLDEDSVELRRGSTGIPLVEGGHRGIMAAIAFATNNMLAGCFLTCQGINVLVWAGT